MEALIVTTQYVYNYGAVLQAYGFSQFLLKHGWKHTFLNQKYEEKKEKRFSRKWCYQTIAKIRNMKNISKEKRKKDKFDAFVETNFPLTAKIEKSKPLCLEKKYDIYISGGDQLFNRSCLTEPFNFLQFADDESIRISYSTSFGSAEFNEAEKEVIKQNLSKYSEISLREKIDYNRFELLETLNIRNDIDGSLLIGMEDWKKAEIAFEGLPAGGYVLVYELLYNEELKKAAEKLRKELSLPIVLLSSSVSHSVDSIADIVIKDAGPGEFLFLFHKASAVLTTSFHGTCFSIVYEKPFFSFVSENEKRINRLLDDLNFQSHYGLKMDKWVQNVDFSIANSIIEGKREEANKYLGRYFELNERATK